MPSPEKEGLGLSGLEKAHSVLHDLASTIGRERVLHDSDDLRLAADAVGRLRILLSTGQLVEKERLLSDEAHQAATQAIVDLSERTRDPLPQTQAIRAVEAALHTATQSKEGQ